MADEFRIGPGWTVVHEGAFVARGAVVAGDVHLGAGCGVWFSAVVRGDTDAIRIGPRCNVQDGAVIHADPGFPTTLGEGVTVGHRAIVHGATVGDETLVGMGAVLMNGVTVGRRCLIAAGALLTAGKTFPDEVLILGSPAKAVRPLTEAELHEVVDSARHYQEAALAFRAAGWHDPDLGGGPAS